MGSFSHSIINLLSPSGSSPESSKGLLSRTAEHPFRPEVSDEEDEEDDSPTRKTPPSATHERTNLKRDKTNKTTLSSDLLLSDESSSDDEEDGDQRRHVCSKSAEEEKHLKETESRRHAEALQMMNKIFEVEKQRKLMFLKSIEEQSEGDSRQSLSRNDVVQDERAAAASKREKLIAEMEQKREIEHQRNQNSNECNEAAIMAAKLAAEAQAEKEKMEQEAAKVLREIEERRQVMEEAEKQAARMRSE